MILKVFKSPLERPEIKELSYVPETPLGIYLKEIDIEDCKIIVTGKARDLDFIPKKTDEVIVLKIVRDPVSISAAAWTAFTAFAVAHPILTAIYVLTIAYSIYSYLTAPRGLGAGNGMDQGSPTYTWEGGRTIQEVGTPVPIIYGVHKCWGNIINQYQSSDGDKNYINMLLLLCEGEICSVDDIKVNDIPIEAYQNAEYEVRLGTNDQTPIDGFSELHSLEDINFNLKYNKPVVYTTRRDDVEALELYFSFPKGLLKQSEGSGGGKGGLFK